MVAAAELEAARRLSEERFGRRIDFFLPGMFTLYGRRGRYPAVSLTGTDCRLGCDHCSAGLLRTMIPALTPEDLVRVAAEQKEKGRLGLLVSGGCDERGRLPWAAYLGAIERVVAETGLIVTVHSGLIDFKTALGLKKAGVAQALIDVIADDDVARRICRLPDGAAGILGSLRALWEAGLDVAPHIVVGLDYGRMDGERRAVDLLGPFRPRRLVTVVLTPKSGTPMAGARPPGPDEVADFLVYARKVLPEARHHLGCARPGGVYRQVLDRLAIRAGINALAVPGDEAVDEARRLGLEVGFHDVCCSLAGSMT
ncbi:MAG: radical SAM protein [Pseudomonadota bacterium]